MQRFVDASIIGWYNYLYGDNKVANDLIKSQNPDMTDGQIAYTIGKMNEYGLLESGEALDKGIGCMTEERYGDFFNKLAGIGLYEASLDWKKAINTSFTCKSVGVELVK